MLSWEEEVKLCEKWFADDFKISQNSAHRIIRDLELEDILMQRYEEELAEEEEVEKEEQEREWEYIQLNDGWSDHLKP